MRAETQIWFVFLLVSICTVLYIVCACIPSMEEIKETFKNFRKKKDNKETFACPIEMHDKLHKMYPSKFTTQKETTKIISDIIKPKTFKDFKDTNECLNYVNEYIIKHPEEF